MKRIVIYTLLLSVLFIGCSNNETQIEHDKIDSEQTDMTDVEEEKEQAQTDTTFEQTKTKTISPKESIDLTAFERTPTEWGENVTGVKRRFKTSNKEMALTFDACGGAYGGKFDEQLIQYLEDEQIPATLFINERWINENKQLFMKLSENPLFQIENHGTYHLPLSVQGGEAWGIRATTSPEEALAEIMDNHETVKELTGIEMTLFRSGTAYYDEVAVELANALGYTVVNFDILGDAGATYRKEQVKSALLEATPGSIALLHMNQPTSETAEGVMEAIPILKQQGFEFVQLTDVQFE